MDKVEIDVRSFVWQEDAYIRLNGKYFNSIIQLWSL